MHRAADRRRRLLLLRRTESDAGTPASCALTDDQETDAETDESRFVNSHIFAPDPGDMFLAACRAEGRLPRLRITPGWEAAAFHFEFRRPFALIGRSDRCDLRFEHADVSYRHAYLQIVGGRLHCFDLASRTGTRWPDGSRVSGCVDGQGPISVGPVSLEYLGDAEASSEDTSILLAGDEPLPAVYLEWTAGRGEGRPRIARLKRSVNLLGWSKGCHVRFARGQVSRVHASLVLTGAGVWIIDLLGRGGTLLEGKRVACARLQDGAELQIGTFGFRLRLGEPPAESSKRGSRRERDRSSDVVIHQNIVVASPVAGAAPQVATSTWSSRDAIVPPAPPQVPSLAAPSSGLSEGFVLALFSQFAEMQRAMFSQTQQQMTFMTEMLGSLHRNQQELIREDLRRVHEINRELQWIQMQLLQQSAAGRPGGGRAQYRLTAEPGSSPESSSDASGPTSEENPSEDIVDVTFDFESTGDPFAPPPAGAPRGRATRRAADPDDESDVVPLTPEGEVAPDAPVPGSGPRPERPRGAVEQHAWLLERMSRLERERSGRWRKIMSLMKGGRS